MLQMLIKPRNAEKLLCMRQLLYGMRYHVAMVLRLKDKTWHTMKLGQLILCFLGWAQENKCHGLQP